MGSLVREDPQIAEYFRDAVLEIVDPNVLKQVIDELDSRAAYLAQLRSGPSSSIG